MQQFLQLQNPFYKQLQWRSLLIMVAVLGICTSASAQNVTSNQRTKTLLIEFPQQTLDTLSVISSSVLIQKLSDQSVLDTAFYQIQNNILVWDSIFIRNSAIVENDSVKVEYRIFPYQFAQRQKHLDTLKMERSPQNADYIGFDFNPYQEENKRLLDDTNLQYNGSFSRGISVGNSQNLVLNSDFNLQMAGKVGDVELLAAISDQNIPLQPEGNTQQLQDFDKLFIQISKDEHQLLAGDYEISNPDNYFLRYYKKLQGATYSYQNQIEDNRSFSAKASIAISRGKFARNNLMIQEGNQGPYRLEGNEGEQFIILLAGTERVYIDGILQKRGIEYDYVVDYNRGDITFTANELITKDSRVIVEFEYSDQQFLRSLYAVESDYQTDKTRLYINVFSQQDSKNTSGLTELSAAEKQTLASIGDQLDNALFTGVRPIEDNNNPVTYAYIDTLVNGIFYDSILVYEVDENIAEVTARFSEVGFGNGNYVRDATAANGTVFEWVAPDVAGVSSGNFAPIIRLVAPISHQIYSVGIEHQINKKSRIQAEVALSNQNLNRFSKLDQQDNLGLATYTQYRLETPLSQKDSTWMFSTDLSYEYKQAAFEQLNPYRNQEFVRDWNIDLNQMTENEHIGKAQFQLQRANWGYANYTFSTFLKGNEYTGNRHFSQINIQQKGFELLAETNLLNTETINEQTQFFRPKLDISKTLKKANYLKIGLYSEREQNRRMQSDTLTANSFYYDLVRAYIETNPKATTFYWKINWTQRWDYSPLVTDFEQNAKANSIGVEGRWKQNKFSNLKWNFTYRKLDIQRPDLTAEQALETYLGRLEYRLNLLKGGIKSSTTYEIGAGQEPKLEYNYLKVNPGEGIYQWNDYNLDSLQQVNEFEIAVTSDQAQWIRVSVLTNDFIRSNNIGLNQNLSINPRAIWLNKKTKFYKTLNRFSSQSVFKINRKTRKNDNIQLWNPLQQNVADTSLVTNSTSIRNTLFFNRTNPKFDIQIGQFTTENRLVLSTGFESRSNQEQFIRGRWNIWKPFTLTSIFTKGDQNNDSEFFNERDFDVKYQKIEFLGIYQLEKKVQLEVELQNERKNNQLGDQEKVDQQSIAVKATFFQSSNTAISSGASFTKIEYDGTLNTAVSFALLESLQPGQNFAWNVQLNRQLNKSIQLSLNYEGRKNGDLNIVHLGQAQLRALF